MSVNKAESQPSGRPSKNKKKPVRKAVRKIVKVTLYRVLIAAGVDPATVELTNPSLKRAWILDQDLPLPDGHNLFTFTKTMAGPGCYRIEKKDANNNPVEVVGLMIDSTLVDRQRGRAPVNEREIEEPDELDTEEPEYEQRESRPRPRRFRYTPRARRRSDRYEANPQSAMQPVKIPTLREQLEDTVDTLELLDQLRAPKQAEPVKHEREEVSNDPLHSIVKFITEDPDSFREVAGKVRGLFSADGPVVAEESPVGWVDFAMEALPVIGPHVGPALGQLVNGLVNRWFPQSATAPGASSGQPQQPGATGAPAGQQQPGATGAPAGQQQSAQAGENPPPEVQEAIEAFNSVTSRLLFALSGNAAVEPVADEIKRTMEKYPILKESVDGLLGRPTEEILKQLGETPGVTHLASLPHAASFLDRVKAAVFGPDEKGGKAALL